MKFSSTVKEGLRFKNLFQKIKAKNLFTNKTLATLISAQKCPVML